MGTSERAVRIANPVVGDDYFPVTAIGDEAPKEKKGRSPTFEMHFWWGRKPLVAARAAILAVSLPDDFDRQNLLYLLGLELPVNKRKQRAFNRDVDIDTLKSSYEKVFGTPTPTLLDPFAGGGSIPYEALRLGFNVKANDYNPVSWTILNATLGYPKQYGKDLYKKIKEVYLELINRLENKISSLYPTSGEWFPITYMYAWRIRCPYCLYRVPLVNNWVLKKKMVPKQSVLKNAFEWTYMVPKFSDPLQITIKETVSRSIPADLHDGTVKRGKATCPNCFNVIANKHLVSEIQQHEDEVPLCVVESHPSKKGKQYRLFSENELAVWDNLLDLSDQIDVNLLPNFMMPPKLVPASRYLGTWDRLTNPRQRYFMTELVNTALELSHEKKQLWGEEWGKICATYLSLVIGKSIDFNSRCTSWASKEGIRNSLAFRRPSMAWDHCEINPIAKKGSGNLHTITGDILRGLETACKHLHNTPGKLEISYGSIIEKNYQDIDVIVTDPPYADDVQYPELSEFFYAWQQRLLHEFFPFLEKGATPRTDDLSANKQERNNEVVEFGLSLAFEKLHEWLKPHGRLNLFFANGKIKVWSFVINALRDARFVISSTFPVHTESKDNVIALGKASFMTSILINASKRQSDECIYFEDVEYEMREFLRKNIQSMIELGLRGSDLSMAALGPALKFITQFSEIKSMSGTLDLSNILSITSEILLEEIIGNKLVKSLDEITQGYLYSRLSGQTEMSYDAFQQMAKSLGIDIQLLRNSSVFQEQNSGKRKSYELLDYRRRGPASSSLIDTIHLGLLEYEKGDIDAFWLKVGEDRSHVLEVLKLIKYGIHRSNLSPILDPDAKISQELLESNYRESSII